MTRSPRPWHYYFDANTCTINDADGVEIAILSGRNEHPLEDAQTIVECVNRHEDLVAALKAALEALAFRAALNAPAPPEER